MKKYIFTDQDKTWWAEYRVDGMLNSDNQTVLQIRSKSSTGVISNTDLADEMIVIGLPNQVGHRFTEVEFTTFANTKSLRLIKTYQDTADNYLRTSSAKNILTYSVPGQVGVSVIDTTEGTVAVGVESDVDVTDLIATFTLSTGAFATAGSSTDQTSGVTENDFTTPVTYTVHSETPLDMKEFVVTVTVLSNDALITGFDLAEKTGAATIDDTAGTIAITVANGTSPLALVPTITKSTGATMTPASGVAQDFTDPVVYTVTSQDLTVEKEYTVTVTIAEA
jgi:hypothetical protein